MRSFSATATRPRWRKIGKHEGGEEDAHGHRQGARRGHRPGSPTKVEKMISGAGSIPPIARPSTNWLFGQPVVAARPRPAWRKGITVKAPPKVSRPGLQPLEEDRRGQRDAIVPTARRPVPAPVARRASGPRPSQRRAIRPQLVGEPGRQQHQHEARRGEGGQREGGDGDRGQPPVGDEGPARAAPPRAATTAPTAAREAVEERVEMAREVGLDVEDREAEHEDEARQHEAEPGEEAAELAAAQPPEVDAQLVRLRPGKHLVDGEHLLERVLARSSRSSSTHSRLIIAICAAGPPPGEGAELEEADEDRGSRFDGAES